METIRSRHNELIRRFRMLGADGDFRREQGEFIGAGQKLLDEAEKAGADVTMVLGTQPVSGRPCRIVTPELLDYVSPLKNSPGPVFSVRMRPAAETKPRRAIVLENVQDPGNVGTVLRTAAALGTELVVLLGDCADPYNPKTVRAAMGALFRQRLWETDLSTLCAKLREWELPLCGAALRAESVDVKCVSLRRAAIAVGNEGRGLTDALLEKCDTKIILPMTPGSESLNAAVAASILMWEMWTQRG